MLLNEKATDLCNVDFTTQQMGTSATPPDLKDESKAFDLETNDVQQSTVANERILQIIIDRVRAVTIRTLLCVQGILTKAIVDTGAEVTVLSERLYNMFPENKRPKLQKANRGLVVAEAGREMNICGLIDAEFKIGEFEFTWPVYVAPIRDDILLGCDIIDEMDITVNTKRGIQVKDQWVECEITRSHDSVGPVKVARAVTVPAYSEFVMTGLCNSLPAEEGKTFIFEASEVAKEKLLIAKSLTRPKSCKIPIKMINHSTSPIRLKKGLVLGTLQPVGSVMPTNEKYNIRQHEEGVSVCRLKTHEDKHQRELSNAHSSSNKEGSHPDGTNFTCIFDEEDGTSAYPQVSRTNESLIPEVPVHLQELFHQSTASLDEGQKAKLKKLLLKYQDAFAKAPTELGKCSLLKHKIDTAEAAPVRQPMRRTPQAFEGEEEKYLKEQLAAGVIQPSSSPSSSPIVMVLYFLKFKMGKREL